MTPKGFFTWKIKLRTSGENFDISHLHQLSFTFLKFSELSLNFFKTTWSCEMFYLSNSCENLYFYLIRSNFNGQEFWKFCKTDQTHLQCKLSRDFKRSFIDSLEVQVWLIFSVCPQTFSPIRSRPQNDISSKTMKSAIVWSSAYLLVVGDASVGPHLWTTNGLWRA